MAKQHVNIENSVVLITGAAGFIGGALARRLLDSAEAAAVVGVDNMGDYYDVALKQARLDRLEGSAWTFVEGNIADAETVERMFERYRPTVVIHLAAQAGVRFSLEHPDAYIENNIVGTYNVLEACRRYPVEHLVFASSSSVYGGNEKAPFSTDDKTDAPVSLYAATKKSGELLAYAYSKLYDIPTTGLRFFTVYGPYGRPDMFLYTATEKLLRGETVQLFNYGNCIRDFTYIDDIVEGIVRVSQEAPARQSGSDGLPIAPYALYNIGGGCAHRMLEVIGILQEELVNAGLLPADYDFDAHRELVGMQPGDVPMTCADTEPLLRDFGFAPSTGLRDGIRAFVAWYADYRNL